MAIPTRDSLLVPYSTNFNNRLVASGVSLYKLTALQVAAYTALHTPYIAAHDAVVLDREAGNRSRSLTNALALARSNLLTEGRQLYAAVQVNPLVSDADKILLGVRVRGARSPIPAPGVRPGLDLTGVVGRTVSLRVHDSASSTRRGKPAGATAAYVYSFVGAEYPADPADWKFEGAATKSKFDVLFPADVAGGTQVWVAAAWVNAKQQSGPLCTPVSTNLQGGGAVGEASLKIAA